MEQAFERSMILVIANQGFSAEIMETAKEAGVTGGAVVHATGLGLENLETFSGMVLKPEEELILILTQQSLRKRIMQAMVKTHGSGAGADAFVFSLLVDQVVGLTSQKSHRDRNVQESQKMLLSSIGGQQYLFSFIPKISPGKGLFMDFPSLFFMVQ